MGWTSETEGNYWCESGGCIHLDQVHRGDNLRVRKTRLIQTTPQTWADILCRHLWDKRVAGLTEWQRHFRKIHLKEHTDVEKRAWMMSLPVFELGLDWKGHESPLRWHSALYPDVILLKMSRGVLILILPTFITLFTETPDTGISLLKTVEATVLRETCFMSKWDHPPLIDVIGASLKWNKVSWPPSSGRF